MDNEKNATQEDESWGEYTKIDKDNKPVSKEQREKERRHWNKKNIEEFFVPSGIGRRRRTIIIMLGTWTSTSKKIQGLKELESLII